MTKPATSTTAIRFPSWQHPVEAALDEPDSEKILERVHMAETAIFNRLQELIDKANDPSHEAERQAMTESCKALYFLKRNKLRFPDWEKT